jgi:hypothetical protein
MAKPRQVQAQVICSWIVGAVLCATNMYAHDTLSFDPNAKPEFAMNPDTLIGAAPPKQVIQGSASVRLRPTDMEIDLTVSDTGAYRLLDHDPYQPPSIPKGTAATTPAVNDSSGLPIVRDPHFDADKSLLTKRGETLFIITSNGAKLAPLAVAVDLSESLDVTFHITYPKPLPGPLHLEMTYFNQVPAGQKDIVAVLDAAEKTITSTNMDAAMPYLDVTVPTPGTVAAAPEAPPPTAVSTRMNWFTLVAGVIAGVAAMFTAFKFLRRPEHG